LAFSHREATTSATTTNTPATASQCRRVKVRAIGSSVSLVGTAAGGNRVRVKG
jgi:hypothetical protein